MPVAKRLERIGDRAIDQDLAAVGDEDLPRAADGRPMKPASSVAGHTIGGARRTGGDRHSTPGRAGLVEIASAMQLSRAAIDWREARSPGSMSRIRGIAPASIAARFRSQAMNCLSPQCCEGTPCCCNTGPPYLPEAQPPPPSGGCGADWCCYPNPAIATDGAQRSRRPQPGERFRSRLDRRGSARISRRPNSNSRSPMSTSGKAMRCSCR